MGYVALNTTLHTPCIPVSMLALWYKAGGMMNLRVEDGVSETTRTPWEGRRGSAPGGDQAVAY